MCEIYGPVGDREKSIQYDFVIMYDKSATGIHLEMSIVSGQEFEKQLRAQQCESFHNQHDHGVDGANRVPSVGPIVLHHSPRKESAEKKINAKNQMTNEELKELRKHNHFEFTSQWEDGYHVHLDPKMIEKHKEASGRSKGAFLAAGVDINAKLIAEYELNLSMETAASKETHDHEKASAIKDEHGTWHITAFLDYNFLVGGTFDIVLYSKYRQLEPTQMLRCSLNEEEVVSGCVSSVHSAKNQISLRADVAAGDYKLAIIHAHDDVVHISESNGCTCARFALQLQVDFIPAPPQSETYNMDCDADYLPASFNHPGLLNNHGHMRYFEKVRFAADALDQEIALTLSQPSLFRMIVSHPGLQLDIVLKDKNGDELDLLAFNMRHSSPVGSTKLITTRDEGVFAYLMPGVYTLVLTLDEAILPAKGFCTVVSIAAEVAPYGKGTSVYDNRDRLCFNGKTTRTDHLPDIRELQGVESDKEYKFTPSTTPYSFEWKNGGSQTISSQTFRLSSISLIEVELGTEFLFGDMYVEVKADLHNEKNPGKVWTTRYYDGHQSPDRKMLKVLLSPGSYTLSLLSAPMQGKVHFEHTHSDFTTSEVRGCAFFTFALSVEPVKYMDSLDAAARNDLLCTHSEIPLDFLQDIPGKSSSSNALTYSSFAVIHKHGRFAVPSLQPVFGRHEGVSQVVFTAPFTGLLRVQIYRPEDRDSIQVELRVKDPHNPRGRLVATSTIFSLSSIVLLGAVEKDSEHSLSIKYSIPNDATRRISPCLYFDIEASLTATSDALFDRFSDSMFKGTAGDMLPVLKQDPSCMTTPVKMPFPLPRSHMWAATFKYGGIPSHGCDIIQVVSFTVINRLTEIRASLRYDFSSFSLGIRIVHLAMTHGWKSYRARVVHESHPSYNKQEIASTLLAPGAYQIEIFQLHNDITPSLSSQDIEDGKMTYDVEASWFIKDVADIPVKFDSCQGSGIPVSPYGNQTFESRDGSGETKKGLTNFLSKVTSTMESIPDVGEYPIHVHRYLTVKREKTQHVVSLFVRETSYFRIYLSQDRYPVVHTKIHIHKQGEKDDSGDVVIDTKAVGKESVFYAQKFSLTDGIGGRFLTPGKYYITIQYNGHPIRGFWAYRNNKYAECDHLVHMELAVYSLDLQQRTNDHSDVYPCLDADLPQKVADKTHGRLEKIKVEMGKPLHQTLEFPRYSGYFEKLQFEVPKEGAVLSVDIGIHFISGTLRGFLEGPLHSASFVHTELRVAENRLFIANHTVTEGTYLMHLHDPFTKHFDDVSGAHDESNPFRKAEAKNDQRQLCQTYHLSVSMYPHRDLMQYTPHRHDYHEHLIPHPALSSGGDKGKMGHDGTFSCQKETRLLPRHLEPDFSSFDEDEDEDEYYDDDNKGEGEGEGEEASGEKENHHKKESNGDTPPRSGEEKKESEGDGKGEHHTMSETEGRFMFGGEDYVVENEKDGDEITFIVSRPSILRVWALTQVEGHSMDLVLYSDEGDSVREGASVLALSNERIGTSSVRERSIRVRLRPKQTPYSLVVKHSDQSDFSFLPWSLQSLATVNKTFSAHGPRMDELCNTFSFLFVLEPEVNLDKEMKCHTSNKKNHMPPGELSLTDKPFQMYHMFYFESGYIFSQLDEKASDPNLFRHRMKLHVSSSQLKKHQFVYLEAVIGYNFLLSEYQLVVRDTKGNVLDRGAGLTMAGGHEKDMMFAHALETSLAPGDYFLDIEEDTSTNTKLDAYHLRPHSSPKCFPFMLGISSYSNLDERKPYIVSVEPMGGINLDPKWDLELVITFSQPAHMASAQSMHHDMSHSGAVYLTPVNSHEYSQSIVPSVMRFARLDRKRLIVLFNHKKFHDSIGYKLEIDNTFFVNKHNENFESLSEKRRKHIYHFGHSFVTNHDEAEGEEYGYDDLQDLDPDLAHEVYGHDVPVLHSKSGHPDLPPLEGDESQNPEESGPEVDSFPAHNTAEVVGLGGLGFGVEQDSSVHCSVGHHPAGRKCEPNTFCKPETCNGHGLCDDTAGYPKCTCLPGFATVGDDYCKACDNPHHKYPDCYQEGEHDDEADMNNQCSSAILPLSLNAPGLLSPQAIIEGEHDGGPSMHSSDWYHVNHDAGVHVTRFELHVESVFRVYVSSDENIKVGLYKADNPESPILIAGGSTSVPKETGIYKVLTKGQYNLAYMYEHTNYYGSVSQCPQMYVELAIEPLAAVSSYPQSAHGDAQTCVGLHKRPVFENQHPAAPKVTEQDENSHEEKEQAPHPHDSSTHRVVNTEASHKVPHTGFVYRGYQHFAASSMVETPHLKVDAGMGDKSYITINSAGSRVFSFPFRIPEYLGHQAYLNAYLEFDFLVGQLRMEIAHHLKGSHEQPIHQQDSDGSPAVMAFHTSKYADSYMNQNMLRMPLPPGEYTLTVFEPLAQNNAVTRCILYDFRMHIGFVKLPHAYQKKRSDVFHHKMGGDGGEGETDDEEEEVYNEGDAAFGYEEQEGGELDDLEDFEEEVDLDDIDRHLASPNSIKGHPEYVRLNSSHHFDEHDIIQKTPAHLQNHHPDNDHNDIGDDSDDLKHVYEGYHHDTFDYHTDEEHHEALNDPTITQVDKSPHGHVPEDMVDHHEGASAPVPHDPSLGLKGDAKTSSIHEDKSDYTGAFLEVESESKVKVDPALSGPNVHTDDDSPSSTSPGKRDHVYHDDEGQVGNIYGEFGDEYVDDGAYEADEGDWGSELDDEYFDEDPGDDLGMDDPEAWADMEKKDGHGPDVVDATPLIGLDEHDEYSDQDENFDVNEHFVDIEEDGEKYHHNGELDDEFDSDQHEFEGEDDYFGDDDDDDDDDEGERDGEGETDHGTSLGTRSHHRAHGHKKKHVSRSMVVPLAQEVINEECNLRPLPWTFNRPGYLGFNGIRMHLHERYRYDPTGHTHDIVFNVTSYRFHKWSKKDIVLKNLFRLTIPFHQSQLRVRVTLAQMIVDKKTKQYHFVKVGSMDNYEEDVMSAVIGQGSYLLRFEFDVHFTEQAGSRPRSESIEQLACLGFDMELFIGPRPRVAEHYNRDHYFGDKTFLPSIPHCPELPFIYHNPHLELQQSSAENHAAGSFDPLAKHNKQGGVGEHESEDVGNPDKDPRYRPRPFVFSRTFHKNGEHWLPEAHERELATHLLIAKYPIENAWDSFLEIELHSDFARGQMGLKLQRIGDVGAEDAEEEEEMKRKTTQPSHHVVYGTQSDLNTQTLYTELVPGVYELSIILLGNYEDLDFDAHHLDQKSVTLAYEFDLQIRILEDKDEVHVCLLGGKQILPHSLNSVRYLGTATSRDRDRVILDEENLHFFASFLLPSVHMHERRNGTLHGSTERYMFDTYQGEGYDIDAKEMEKPEHPETYFITDKTQFSIHTISIFRLTLNAPADIRVKLTEFPCSRQVPRTHPSRLVGMGHRCKPVVVFDEAQTDFSIIRFVSQGVYELEVEEFNPASHQKKHGCQSYTVELVIEPLSSFNHHFPSAVCPKIHGVGVDHWPPHPPTVISKPFHYSSRQLQERLYFQQRNHQTRAESMSFTVKQPFRFYAELDFEYATGDLIFDLMKLDSNDFAIHRGTDHFNHHVLSADYLPPGKYMLTIREPQDGEMGWFCTFFDFTLEIQPIRLQVGASFGFGPHASGLSVFQDPLLLLSPLQRILPPYPHVPKTLDTMAFMGVKGNTHFFGTYSLLHNVRARNSALHHEDRHNGHHSVERGPSKHTPELQNTMTFTVKKKSVIRVFVSPHATQGGSTDFFADVSIFRVDTVKQENEKVHTRFTHIPSLSNRKRLHLDAHERSSWTLAVVDVGTHTVVVEANRTRDVHGEGDFTHAHHSSRWFDWGRAFLADVEVAIQPLWHDNMELVGDPEKHPDHDPIIKLEETNGVYHFSSNALRLCNLDEKNDKLRSKVHHIPFTADSTVIVFVELSYDFLESHLVLTLEGHDATGHIRMWNAVPRLNGNQLYVTAPAGSWAISVHSFGPLPALTTNKVHLSGGSLGCSRFYSLSVFIHRVGSSLPDHLKHQVQISTTRPVKPVTKGKEGEQSGQSSSSSSSTSSSEGTGVSPSKNGFTLDAKYGYLEPSECKAGLRIPSALNLLEGVTGKDTLDAAAGDTSDEHPGYSQLFDGVYVHNSAAGFDKVARLHGEGFGFSNPHEVDWQWMKIPVTVPSLLRVDVRKMAAEHSNVRVVMFKASNTTVMPIEEHVRDISTTQLYALEPSKLMYFLGIGTLASNLDSLSCPSFALDLSIVPDNVLRHNLFTKANCPTRLPPSDLVMSEKGYARQVLHDGSWQATSHSLEVPIKFTVTVDSYISAYIHANFMSAAFELTLEKESEHGKVHYILMRGTEESSIADEWGMDSKTPMKSNYLVSSDLDTRVELHGFLEKGTYTLFLRERLGPVLQEHFKAEVPACHKFTYDMQIEPFDDPVPITSEQTPSTSSPSSSSPDSSTTTHGETHGEGQGHGAASPSSPSHTAGGDQAAGHGTHEGLSSTQVEEANFRECVNGGHPSHDRHGNMICECPYGYGGPSCSDCADGFFRNKDHDCELKSAPSTPDRGRGAARRCSRITCGCENINIHTDFGEASVDLDRCISIGTCHNTNDGPVCECPFHYAGANCERCAKGFYDYPRCVPYTVQVEETDGHPAHQPDTHAACGICHHGHCDVEKKQCVCENNYTGKQCSIQLRLQTQMGGYDHAVRGGASIYIVYGATLVACVIIVGGLWLHFRSRKKRIYAASGRSYELRNDDGL